MLDILPSGCKTQKFSEFYRHPGLTLSAVGICTYNPNDLYSEKISHWIKMKTIEVDDELYRYIASHTLHIGESASDILRRMLKFPPFPNRLHQSAKPRRRWRQRLSLR
ncbi:replication initiation regulator SeqA [Klebsiella pneumoniae]|uniref:Replication initiation regulator SeqA n=1 Tax=Klebsiella pneumoniae TaxID=573 RepID=A0A2X3J183_KLEPN|nr:replication initiation regulator SeqA [Klebsiella pneumoniae]